MRKASKLFNIVLTLCLLLLFVSCNKEKEPEYVDYVSQVKLTQSFEGKKFVEDGIEEVTLLHSVDGDTIHVYNHAGAQLQLRFLGVDTPESTAQVEAWGLAASNFTKNIVKNCTSLVITSDGGPAERDTYERYLAWVWYQPAEGQDYRLLNLELVQEGYSRGKNAGVKNYYDELVSAADQARKQGIKVWGEKDPNYSYNDVLEVSLPYLKQDLIQNGHKSEYLNKKVVFEAVVARFSGSTYYLSETDYSDPKHPEGITYSIQVYHTKSTGKLDKVGTRVRISGTVVYYETGDVFQLSSVIDRTTSSNVNNLKVIEEVNIEPKQITPEKLDVNNKALEYNLVSMNGLVVKSTYTTDTEGSSNRGAITITCEVEGQEVTVRTAVIYDHEGIYEVDSVNRVTASNFEGKTIDVVGIIEKYQGKYQIKLLSMDDVVIR